MAHWLLKSFYMLTNKKNATKQMAKKYAHLETLHMPVPSTPAERAEEAEADSTRLDSPYFISHSHSSPLNILEFIQSKPMDPAKRLFLPSLQNHILRRLLACDFDGNDKDEFMDEDQNCIRFLGDKLYHHVTF